MEKICAVIDCQGFQFENKFIPREVAIVSDYISQCQELDPGIDWKALPQSDQNVITHSTKYIHGLFYRPFNPDKHCYLKRSFEIGDILKPWYEMVATNEKYIVAHKNPQLGLILKELGIENIDLSELGFPSYGIIQDKYSDNYLCSYHKKPRNYESNKLICAYRKANHLFREVK